MDLLFIVMKTDIVVSPGGNQSKLIVAQLPPTIAVLQEQLSVFQEQLSVFQDSDSLWISGLSPSPSHFTGL